MQALLAEHAWDWTAALAALQRFILARLGDQGAIVVLDETAELKKGTATVGVGRQHGGITGQVENCQTVVFAAYVTARAHALFDFRLYLPKQWCWDKKRRQRAHVPDDVAFATKPALGTAMLTAAASAGVPFAWAAADEVHGRSSKLREACEKAQKGYVLAVPVNFTVRGGHRDYAWAWAATASPRHQVLIRRSLTDPDDLVFFYCHAPARPAGVAARADQGRREEMAGRSRPPLLPVKRDLTFTAALLVLLPAFRRFLPGVVVPSGRGCSSRAGGPCARGARASAVRRR